MSAVLDPTLTALREFVGAIGGKFRIVLIGGQAMVDWIAWQRYRMGTSFPPGVVGRTTEDLDVHIHDTLVNIRLVETHVADKWTDGELRGRYYWKSDARVMMDLIVPRDGTGTGSIAARIGGSRGLFGMRVIPSWIIDAGLSEHAHTQPLIHLGMQRLTRLGLIASKADAVRNCLAEIDKRGADARTWSRRLGKDLQDLQILLDPDIDEPLWMPRYEAVRGVIESGWRHAVGELKLLRTLPPHLDVEDRPLLEDVVPRLPKDPWPR
jgi:hypothetical protein